MGIIFETTALISLYHLSISLVIDGLTLFLEKLYELCPPKLPNLRLKELLSMGSMLNPVRKQGTQGLVDLMRVVPMMMSELMDEWFENELLRAAISTSGIHHLSFGPFAPGTGYNLPPFCTLQVEHAVTTFSQSVTPPFDFGNK